MLTLCFFPFQNDHHQQQYFHFMMHFDEPEFWSTPENMFIDSWHFQEILCFSVFIVMLLYA